MANKINVTTTAHFHQRRRTQIRIRIQIPNSIVTLYYAQLFPLVQIWIWIPVQIVSRMVTVPILGTDLRPRDPNPNPSVVMSEKIERTPVSIMRSILISGPI